MKSSGSNVSETEAVSGEPPPKKWNEYAEGSAQAMLADMSIELLRRLCVTIRDHQVQGAASGFELRLNQESSDGQIHVDVSMQVLLLPPEVVNSTLN